MASAYSISPCNTVRHPSVHIGPAVFPVTLAVTDRAKQLLVGQEMGAREAIHAAVMPNHDVRPIASFDRGFDRVGGIERVNLA